MVNNLIQIFSRAGFEIYQDCSIPSFKEALALYDRASQEYGEDISAIVIPADLLSNTLAESIGDQKEYFLFVRLKEKKVREVEDIPHDVAYGKLEQISQAEPAIMDWDGDSTPGRDKI
jgi:hypothetical protein